MNTSPKRLRDSDADDSSMKKQKTVIPEGALSLKFQTREDENGVIIAENNMTRELLIQYRLFEQMTFDSKVAKLIAKDTNTITVAEIIAWMEGKTFTEISKALEPVCARVSGIIYTLALRLDVSKAPLSKDTPIDSSIAKNMCEIQSIPIKVGESRPIFSMFFPIEFNRHEIGNSYTLGFAVISAIVEYNKSGKTPITIGDFYQTMFKCYSAGLVIRDLEILYPFLKVL